MKSIATHSLSLPTFGDNAIEATTEVPFDSSLGLNGTFYINGPGRFHFHNQSYNHWLDGDGMVTSLCFHGDRLRTTSKYVQGKKYLKESSGTPVFRTFGTRFEGDRLYRGIGTASPYNVSVFKYREQLLAFGEQSLPMRLDSNSLETTSPGKCYDFRRQINEASPFSAHPKIDSSTGELLNFGIFFNGAQPLLIYYRFDSEGRLACRAKHEIDLPSSLHDFAASQNYVVFYLSPHLLDTKKLIHQGKTLSESLCWKPELGSRLLVLCRHSGEMKANIKIEGRYNLHTINAWEESTHLMLDVIEYDRPLYDQYEPMPKLFTGTREGVPTRIQVEVAENQATKIAFHKYRSTPDFPVVADDGLKLDQFWVLGISNWDQDDAKFHDQLAHLDWRSPDAADVWTAPTGWFMSGEPALAATSQGQPLLIAPLHCALNQSSHVGLFDPFDVSGGPIETIKLGHSIPLGFHSSYSADSKN